ncbi:MAG: hypothetical protein AAFU70_04045 [Planctomycetota bacterium]
MAEAVTSVAIVGVIVVGALSATAGVAGLSQSASDLAFAEQMAADLLAEVSTVNTQGLVIYDEYRFDLVDDSEQIYSKFLAGTRFSFYSISQYDGWSNSPPITRYGDPYPGADATWRRTAIIQTYDGDTLAPESQFTAELFRITVIVSRNGRDLVTRRVVRSQVGDTLWDG